MIICKSEYEIVKVDIIIYTKYVPINALAYLEDCANTARAGLSLSGFDFEALIGANVAIRLNSKKETLLSR